MKFEQNNPKNEIDSKNTMNNVKKDIINPKKKTKFDSKLYIIISLIILSIIILIGFIVGIIFSFKFHPTNFNAVIPDLGPLESEFKINTKVNDLKRFSLIQESTEDIINNGTSTKLKIYRKTNYDVIIISEEDSNEQNKNFYNKTYNAAIILVSECIDTKNNSDCIQNRYVDLADQNYSNERNLSEVNDLKDIPVPICLFNITDNGVILSIDCPETLSQNKKNEIFLDLNYIKPVSIKRINKEEGNITITKEIKDNKEYIRETNGGICDIASPIFSFCTMDINTTLDLDGNLLSLNEFDFTNIISGINNSFIKNKITKLNDISYKTKNLIPEKYKISLEKLFDKLIPYMKQKKYANRENFQKLYDDSKNKKNSKNIKRLLYTDDKIKIINKEILFSFTGNYGSQIDLFLINDMGYNSETMKIGLNLVIDDQNYELINIREFTDLDKIIHSLIYLKKAGNNLANRLYIKIKENMDNLTDRIYMNFSNLKNLIVYKDLVEILGSILTDIKILPFEIIEESNNFNNKLDKLLNRIEDGNIKANINILNKNIYDYISNSHKLIEIVFNNLKDLTETFKSPKNKLTEIALYYLNYTSNSYINIIIEAKNILENYYKNEKDLIIPKVESLINNFEEHSLNSITKEINSVNILYEKIKNKYYTIEKTKDDDLKNILSNLYNSNYYINNILSAVNNSLKNEMNLKNNGYFTSNNDIKSFNESYFEITKNSMIVCYTLDEVDYIDKTFDKIMTYARENYTSIIKYIDEQKNIHFPLQENALKDNYFTIIEKNELSNNILTLGISILNKIKMENNDYLKEMKMQIDNFMKNNKEYLNQIIYELNIILSHENLEELANSYEIGFQSCLNKIKNDILTNELLINGYFNDLSGAFENNTKILELLKYFKISNEYMPNSLTLDGIIYNLKGFEDKINSKIKTQGYINKYNIILRNIIQSKEYINNQLNEELLNEYKNMIIKIKELLLSIKSNINDYDYSDYDELNSIDKNIKNIEKLYHRFNKYISNNIFNNKYFKQLQNYSNDKILEINKINNIIEKSHQIINTEEIYNDYNNDFCINFLRKKSYGTGGGSIYYLSSSDYYCFPLVESSNNYNKLSKLSIYSDENINKFKKDFNDFYLLITNKINSYNLKIKELKNILSSTEKVILDKKYTFDYLIPIQNQINKTLLEKYEENLLKGCYDYYQKYTETKVEKMLNDISNKWYDYLDSLILDITNNLNHFNNSFSEISMINSLYINTISHNMTKTYIDSIINHQKNEYNYTIGFYYNFLIKEVNSTQQFIINKIPSNKNGFNNIINQRKKEIEDIFNKIIKQIIFSKNSSLIFKNQINSLNVSTTNFFKINSIVAANIIETQNNLNNKIAKINEKNNKLKENDFYSFVSKYYLENSLSGKQIFNLYEPLDEKNFIDLNLYQFIELLNDNWIFDQDGLILQINSYLYNSNLEIEKEFSINKAIYEGELETPINKYFTKESIMEEINNFYKNGINISEHNKLISQIELNINEIINYFKENILNEVNRLKKTATSYNNNFTIINNTIKEFKNNIFNKLNSTIFSIIDNLYQNIINNYYSNYV